MSKINSELNASKYFPTAMLVVYTNAMNRTYIEAREIFEDGTPGAGKPVTYGMIDRMLKAFSPSHNNIPHGPMPANMLYTDCRESRQKYIWWNPPGRRSLKFVPSLSMEDGEYMMPGVIYMVENNTLSVFAFHGKRPNPRQLLLKGPFFNYYNDGRICLGSAQCPLPEDLTWEAVQKGWENLFWNSKNSHTIDGALTTKGNLTTILKEMKDAEKFDTSLLIKTNIKLEDLWKKTK